MNSTSDLVFKRSQEGFGTISTSICTMVDYSSLVSRVLRNDILKEAIDDMKNENNLNLVTKDWLLNLENNITYQDFSSNSASLWKKSYSTVNYEYEESKISNFNIVLVGYCKFVKPYEGRVYKPSLTVLGSEPLNKIAIAMLSDFGPNIQISKDLKFNFDECSVLSCYNCSSVSEKFAKSGYKFTQLSQPCIIDTKVFDGKRIVNRFFSQMECTFRQEFIGILHLKINVRYNFPDANKQKLYRISGEILDLVAFHENKLYGAKTIDVGPLVIFEMEENDATKYGDQIKPKSQKRAAEAEQSKKITFLEDDEDEPNNKKMKIFEEEEDFEEDLLLI